MSVPVGTVEPGSPGALGSPIDRLDYTPGVCGQCGHDRHSLIEHQPIAGLMVDGQYYPFYGSVVALTPRRAVILPKGNHKIIAFCMGNIVSSHPFLQRLVGVHSFGRANDTCLRPQSGTYLCFSERQFCPVASPGL